MRFAVVFFILFFMSSCSSDVADNNNITTDTASTDLIINKTDTVSESDISFDWDIKLYSTTNSADELNASRINIIVVRGTQRDTLNVGKFSSPVEMAEKTLPVWANAPAQTIAVLSGWWAGAGDNLFLVKSTNDKYFIKWQPVSEEGELPAENLKQIIVPSTINIKPTIDDIVK
jgi:hypothetical protein